MEIWKVSFNRSDNEKNRFPIRVAFMTLRKLPRYDQKGSAFTASRNITEISIMTESCALLKMLRVPIAVLSAAMACYIYQHKRQATLRILVWDDLRDTWGKCQRVNVCCLKSLQSNYTKGKKRGALPSSTNQYLSFRKFQIWDRSPISTNLTHIGLLCQMSREQLYSTGKQ